MRWLILLLILSACSSSVVEQEESKPQTEQKRGTIVAYGDSLTEGLGVPRDEAYPAQLEKKLQEKGYAYRVVNAGISGETSSGAASRVEWILTLKPDIVILETGGNDGLRGINPAIVKENLATIITALQAADVQVILAGMHTLENLGAAYNEEFSAVYPAIAQEFDVAFIEFFLEGVAADPFLNQADLIHPTSEGYTYIVENNVLPILEPLLAEA